MMESRPFVLSGGGTRGFAHLGVVKALQEHGISPSAISGTSSGAMAGAFLACGYTPDEIREMFVGKIRLSMLSYHTGRMGLASMHKMREFLKKNLRAETFGELKLPLYITATDFTTGKQKIFTEGNLLDAVIASCSIPALFPPLFIDDVPYVDGAIYNNLPVEPFCHCKCDTVCVYVNPTPEFTDHSNVLAVIDRAWHLLFREMVDRSAEGCHLFIEPPDLQKYGLFDVNKLPEIFETGYLFAREIMQGKTKDERRLPAGR